MRHLLTHSWAHAGAVALETKSQLAAEQHGHDGTDVVPPAQLSVGNVAQPAMVYQLRR